MKAEPLNNFLTNWQALTVGSLAFYIATNCHGGPFASHRTNGVEVSEIVAWASETAVYAPTAEVAHLDPFGGGPHDDPSRALGPADGTTVSLGDLDATGLAAGSAAGSLTLRFTTAIFNGPGPDLAVFENAFEFTDAPSADFIFAELAFVEVSTDGEHFVIFPAVSLNIDADPSVADDDLQQLHVPFGRDFAGVNTTNLHNFAGVHPTLTGTPFDLDDLVAADDVVAGRVDLDEIYYVRLVDVPGNGSVTDSRGNPIHDAWHTVDSGGLDVDAVGILHQVPEPSSVWLVALGAMLLRRVPRCIESDSNSVGCSIAANKLSPNAGKICKSDLC